MLAFIRHFRAIRGSQVVDMMDVAGAAIAAGFQVPNPMTPQERLAHEFANVARMQRRTDELGGFEYRVNQAFTMDTPSSGQLTLWVDIDHASRQVMEQVVRRRRKLIEGTAQQLTFDMKRWNSTHEDEAPLRVNLNFNHLRQ